MMVSKRRPMLVTYRLYRSKLRQPSQALQELSTFLIPNLAWGTPQLGIGSPQALKETRVKDP